MGGIHTICVQTTPKQKFVGFGLPPSGATEEEILELLVNAFNDKPIRTVDILAPALHKLDEKFKNRPSP